MSIYHWRELSSVPSEPGVYAWYYRPEITQFDLESILAEVQHLKKQGDTFAATGAVRDFLFRNIFRYFAEEPYEAIIKGALKPKYEGTLEHKPALSEPLIERIVNEPLRLHTIQRVLELSAPNFSSPLYIGMSEKLRLRLLKHKELIERYADMPPNNIRGTITADGEQRDHSFAQEIAKRKISPTRLFVTAQVLDGAGTTYIDIENILNRIHYPLFGRN